MKRAQGLREPLCDRSGIRWTVINAWGKNKNDFFKGDVCSCHLAFGGGDGIVGVLFG